MEPARAPVHGVGVGRVLHPGGRPVQLRERDAANPPAKPQVAPAVYGGQVGPKRLKKNKRNPGHQPIYAWTDLTYLLHKDHVSWGYYVVSGTEPDCENDAGAHVRAGRAELQHPGIWNPLPWFDTVKTDNQLGNIQVGPRLLRRREERHPARGVLDRPIG